MPCPVCRCTTVRVGHPPQTWLRHFGRTSKGGRGWTHFGRGLADLFDVVQLPRLVEISLLRSVESEVGKPTPAGNCLDPILGLRGFGRTEIEVHRAVRIGCQLLAR